MTGERAYALHGFAVPAELERLHDLLERVGHEHPEVEPLDLTLFETAVIEVAGNVVEHGRPPGEVRWSFSLEIADDCLVAVLSDSGQEFQGDLEVALPDDLAESGRGLPLARAALDEFSYRREGGSNHWRMVRRAVREEP